MHAQSQSHVQLLWTHGLQPAGFLCPWDFLGKNIGVGCHFLLQGIFLTQGLNLSPVSPALAGRFFTTEPLGSPYAIYLLRSKCSRCKITIIKRFLNHLVHLKSITLALKQNYYSLKGTYLELNIVKYRSKIKILVKLNQKVKFLQNDKDMSVNSF